MGEWKWQHTQKAGDVHGSSGVDPILIHHFIISISSTRNAAISINKESFTTAMKCRSIKRIQWQQDTKTQLMFLGMGWHWSLLQFHPKRPTIETATCVAPTQWQTKTLAGWAVIVFWFYLFLFFVGGRKKRTSKAKKVFLYTSLSSLLHTFYIPSSSYIHL